MHLWISLPTFSKYEREVSILPFLLQSCLYRVILYVWVSYHTKPKNKPILHPGNARNLLAHGGCSSLAGICLLSLGLGDTLGEDSGILVL